MPTNRCRPFGRDRGRLEREVLAHAVRRARRQERVRHGQVAEERPVERVPRAPTAGSRCAAMPSDVTISSPSFASVSPSGSRLTARTAAPSGASSVVTPVNVTSPLSRWPSETSTPQRVEPRRLELALVVGQAVVDAARRVVGDARQPADRRAGERRAGRDDRLPEELQARRLRAPSLALAPTLAAIAATATAPRRRFSEFRS